MADILKLITLTEKNDSGPNYDAFYSVDCLSYTQSVDGGNINLPSVGSTAVITVPEETICIKLQSIPEPCSNFVISGSTTTTTTSTSTTSTTTTTSTSTTSTTTTTTIPVVETYWSGSGCEAPFPISTLLVATSSLSPGDVVKLGNGACYTLIETHEQEPFIKFFIVDEFFTCNECLGITTTTTTLQTFSYDIHATPTNGSAGPAGGCNQPLPYTFYSLRNSFYSIVPGDILYSDSGATTPWNGGNLYYGVGDGLDVVSGQAWQIASDGEYIGAVLCVTTSTTTIPVTTTTTTTTASPTTTIYTDATPMNGNLESCGCETTITQFEIQVLGGNVDITQDMTGDTIYEDYNTNTLFDGDDKWYCIATSNGVTPQYSILIGRDGIVDEWVSSIPCTTTTTTSTTTLDPNGCYEWEVECLTPGGCLVNYTDCNGNAQSFTAQFEVAGLICARPTPTISGGVVNFTGDCTTTTTTEPPTTTTTTTTTSALTQFITNASPEVSGESACSAGLGTFRYHDGSGTYPEVADTVYLTSSTGGGTLGAGYWGLSNDTYFQTDINGFVIDVQLCATPPPTTTTTSSTTPPPPPTTTSTTTTTTAAPNVFVAERNYDGFGSYLQYDAGYSMNDDVLASDGFCWTLGTPTFVLDPTLYGTITSMCPPPTTTTLPTTTTPPTPCTLIDMQTVGSSTSGGACSNGTFGSRRRHNGALPAPGIGDTIFTNIDCSTTFDGGGLWYFINEDTSAVQVGPTGIVTDKVIC